MIQRLLSEMFEAHSMVASTLHLLGCCYRRKGLIGDAEKYFLRSLDMKKKIISEEAYGLDVALTLRELASVKSSQGSLEDSEKLQAQCFSLKRELVEEKLER